MITFLANAGRRSDCSEAEEVVGAKVVRLAVVVESGSPIPTSASNSNGLFLKELQIPETASASESASEIKTGALFIAP